MSSAHSTLGPAQRAQLEAIITNLCHQLPLVAAGAIFTERIIKEIKAVLLKNLSKILSAGLIAGGLSVLIPVLTLAIVNAVGFTAGGVLAGSLAAANQSAVYGGLTGGVFSTLQSFGAVAVMPPPVVIAVAVVAVVVGGYLAYRAFKSKSKIPPDMVSQTADKHDDGHGDPETRRAITWYTPDSDMDSERANRFGGTTTSAVRTGARILKKPIVDAYYRIVRTGYGMMAHSATKHLQAAGNGASTAFDAVGRQTTSATHTTVDFFRGVRRRAHPKASEHRK
ncbi:hypothetical protein D9619_006722 [Psilocybe cf. subviscida]|uniref:Uncharacterized protein n=1 Tax=Psilocybe cf. subviscida TaxID=2480587 RepID=A0A8H5B4N3_9AGAR|nr:hypothetical protein D9619_006722 [Psilocybe cf. subviscida]